MIFLHPADRQQISRLRQARTGKGNFKGPRKCLERAATRYDTGVRNRNQTEGKKEDYEENKKR